MQCRVLDFIVQERLWFVSDGIKAEVQKKIRTTPILSRKKAKYRAQYVVKGYYKGSSGSPHSGNP